MNLGMFRKGEKISQEALGRKVERSKGYISGLESGALRATLRIALQIEDISGGRVPADDLLDDIDRGLLQRHRERTQRGDPQASAA